VAQVSVPAQAACAARSRVIVAQLATIAEVAASLDSVPVPLPDRQYLQTIVAVRAALVITPVRDRRTASVARSGVGGKFPSLDPSTSVSRDDEANSYDSIVVR